MIGNIIHTQIFPLELVNGNIGRGGKWFKSSNLRNEYQKLFENLGLRRRPFEVPVNVHIIRILGTGQREWDSSSWSRGNYKEIEDALVACGWFFDDGPKYIWNTTFENDISRKSRGPCFELVITQAGHNHELQSKGQKGLNL